jgi:Bacterial PH domain
MHVRSDAISNTRGVDALSAIESFFSRGNVRAIRAELWADEEVLAAVVAGHGRPGLGVLGVTPTRILFARERVLRRPLHLSIPLEAVRSVRIERVLGSANLLFEDAAGHAFTFQSIRSLERALEVEDAIRQRAGGLMGHS